MKIIKYLMIISLVAIFAVACEKGLDSINAVDPGPDQAAPGLVINYPLDGKTIRSTDSVANIKFIMVAEDDIELKSVLVKLDGTTIKEITSFLDYRRVDLEINYNQLLDGEYTLTAIATDMADKSVSQAVSFKKITVPPYFPPEGEVLYFPFDGSNEDVITGNEAGVVGSPGFVEGKVGDAYAGAPYSYLTYPTDGILGNGFGIAFWYQLNPDSLRGGIFNISRPFEEYADSTRYKGFRMLRENAGDNQNIGINFGIGDAEVWMNPFITFEPTGEWMHIAISISDTAAIIYVNGEVVMEKLDLLAPINWGGCTSMSIASGRPNFSYWDHLSDLSLFDELHIFNRAITAEEVQTLYAVE